MTAVGVTEAGLWEAKAVKGEADGVVGVRVVGASVEGARVVGRGVGLKVWGGATPWG